MLRSGLVYAPDTPNWAQMRSIEYSYQVSLIADNPDYLRRFMVATQAIQTQALLDVNTQLGDVNRGILGIQQGIGDLAQGIGDLTDAVGRGFDALTGAMQEGFDALGGQIAELGAAVQQGFTAVAAEMQRQNAALIEIAHLLSTRLEGEAREIRGSALSAVQEGCSPEAFDQDASLREALQLFRLTVQHPMGIRDYVAWFNVGWLLWKLEGDLPEAEKAFATAVRQSMEKRDAFHVLAARHLAYMRYLQRNTDGAYQGARMALQASPAEVESLYTLLLIAAQAGNAAEVAATFRELIMGHPERLAACLAERELLPFREQLEPVVAALVGEARSRVRAATEQVNQKLAEAATMARAVGRRTLLQPGTQQQMERIREVLAAHPVDSADWPTIHALAGQVAVLGAGVAADVDAVRPLAAVLRSVEWVDVPAGEFLYGPENERRVLPAFRIMKCPVTVRQYRAYCQATVRQMPSPPGWGWQDDHPIVNVSWHDAVAFCEWAGLALPTEVQWEKAARGTVGREYPWGMKFDAAKCVCSVGSKRSGTAPVGSCPAGASPYGCLDMVGNVWEWCDDWYDEQKICRVLRGGSWDFNGETYFRATFRGRDNPNYRVDYIGFRCVLRADSA